MTVLLAHIPAKWLPVRRSGYAPRRDSRAYFDSAGTEIRSEVGGPVGRRNGDYHRVEEGSRPPRELAAASAGPRRVVRLDQAIRPSSGPRIDRGRAGRLEDGAGGRRISPNVAGELVAITPKVLLQRNARSKTALVALDSDFIGLGGDPTGHSAGRR
jgi:hypothetical protein